MGRHRPCRGHVVMLSPPPQLGPMVITRTFSTLSGTTYRLRTLYTARRRNADWGFPGFLALE